MSPFLFSPIGAAGGTMQVRSSIDARTLAEQLRAELPRVHPSLRLVDVTLQTALVGSRLLLAGGVYFARFVRTFLFEIEPLSPASLGLPVLCLLAVTLVAAWRPARRATRVDPAEALRMD